MDGSKRIYLSNGDELILLDDQYFISHDGDSQPKGIDKEEGEQLLFKTYWQLHQVMETLALKVEKYEKALEEIVGIVKLDAFVLML